MRRFGALTALLLVLAAACSSSGSNSRATLPHRVATADYRPGVGADVFLPATPPAHLPLVVLVPGGGWTSADRTGLLPLADRLAGDGIATVAASYRARQDGARFPVPAADVECAVDFAVARVRKAGLTPTQVVLAGHSAGAHLAMLVGLTGQRFRGACPYPPATVDGVIGLAGPYDIRTLADVARAMFAGTAAQEPAAWHDANPVNWVQLRPQLWVLLVHGAADTTVTPSSTTSFARLLRAAGHDVHVEIVAGADHSSIYRPDVVATRIEQWVAALP